MEIKKLNLSVVVLAIDHNPTILHPSFLTSEGIVPKDWELAEPPLCTPPFSVVKFKNGISFTVESRKFQVVQSPAPPVLENSEIPKLAIRYVEKLPFVRYTAVGINIGVAIKNSNPEDALITKFLRAKNCSVNDLKLKSVSLRFQYPLGNCRLNLSCEPGTFNGGSLKGILVNGNYHTDCPGDNPLLEAKENILKFSDRCKHFEGTVLQKLF
ncbi:MAG: hypothetical protein DRG59_06010 [Deltaproteobacteria bacterium]|nr:MAG: hypothetical protein DRG59_06010 [Deltaproteobacteria bacterium]HEC31517.1 hypothetical protein [Deltaproteobacteria bacterium]